MRSLTICDVSLRKQRSLNPHMADPNSMHYHHEVPTPRHYTPQKIRTKNPNPHVASQPQSRCMDHHHPHIYPQKV